MLIVLALALLPMILVRNQIRNTLGGEIGKITFGRIKYNLGLGAKEFRFVYCILVQWAGADFKVIGIRFMNVFIKRREAACSSGYDHMAALTSWETYILCSFSIHLTESCLCLIRFVAVKLAQAGFGDTS